MLEWTRNNDFGRNERLSRLFGDDHFDRDEKPLGGAILALAERAAEMHRREMDAALEGTGNGLWPAEAWLTLDEFALLHGIDPDSLDGGDHS
jgi:hypothetical protein